MFKEKNKVHILYFLIDIVLIFCAFFIAYFIRFNKNVFLSLNFKEVVFPNNIEYVFIFCLWTFFIVISFRRMNLYCTDRTLGLLKESRMVLTSLLSTGLLILAIIFFAQFKFFSRFIFIASLFILVVLLVSWRLVKRIILRYLIKRGFHNFNILIIGHDDATDYLLEEIKRNSFLGLKVIGSLAVEGEKPLRQVPVLGSLDEFEIICKKYFIDEVVVSSSMDNAFLLKIGKIAKNTNLGIRVMPFNFEDALSLLSINYVGIVPLLTYKERDFHPSEFFGKRIFDIGVSLFLLAFFSPLFFFVMLLIWLDDGRPFFYVQKRMGHKGEIFDFYKFRSMIKDAEQIKGSLLKNNEVKNGIIFKMKTDPRVTRVGRFLRRFSLDELPQLFNVLKGNMSLVGPRPFPVSESQKISISYVTRLNIRPGITGLAQIRGRSDLPFNHWMKFDLWYVNNWSFGIDLKILWWTIAAVLKGKGAY